MPPESRDPMDPSFPPEEKTDIRFKDDLEPPVGDAAYPCLEVLAGPGLVGSRFALKQGTTTIGRSTENVIVLDDSSVSRLHAEVEVSGERFTIRDAGSRNGVKVGGQKIGQPLQVGQESQIKVGLYEFRLLLGPAGEAPKPPQKKSHLEETSQTLPEAVPEEPMIPEEPVGLVQRRGSFFPKKLLFYLALIMITAGSGYLMYRFLIPKLLPPLASIEEPGKEAQVDGGISQAPGTSPQAATTVPLFLDFTATPIPAEIYFGDQKIGVTPFRIQTPLRSNKIYEVKALFHLTEADQTLEAKVNFSPPPGAQVLTVPFVGRVGLFKIASLPRESTLYLEGYFEGDPFRAKPIKFSEVVFDKPIYMPYGKYVLELRKNRQLGTSQTFLDEVVFHREFVINEQTNNYTI
ncbi:MAG: FHA domain-containing protein, partial [Deltaproteobacteria bacterium]|nr:FHA domain-containing protein [Deltaproteobacteria bacterium]